MRLLFVLLLLFPLACAKPVTEGSDLAKITWHFSEAMRWQDFSGAVEFMAVPLKEAFREEFKDDDDLHVVESRIVSVNLDQVAETAEVDYLLEYYRLPSMSVKKWRWQQSWRLQNEKPAVWRIENPPPQGP